MKNTDHHDSALSGVEEGLKSLLNAQLLLGTEVLKLAVGSGGILNKLSTLKLSRFKRCCHIPPACWMPLSLGEIGCHRPAGDSATICLVVTNGDFRPHTYEFAATGKSAAAVSFSATSVTLGPKERVAVSATFTLPAGTVAEDCRCVGNDVVIWVRGCRDHYLHWIVEEGATAGCCSAEIAVCDDPDYVLHWYDHFYTLRPCFGTVAGNSNPVRGTAP
jgi:hypothetical protein